MLSLHPSPQYDPTLRGWGALGEVEVGEGDG